MPGVLGTTVPTRPSAGGKAESIKLWLPSHLDAAERDSLCSGGVIASERELRFGQLHDALDELRRARRIRRGLIIFHKVQLTGEGQGTQTKSRTVIRTIQERIDRSVQRYRVARDALLQLEPSGSWLDLYPILEDRDNRGPGKELEEVRTSDGRYSPSWIWLSNPSAATGDPAQNTISPDEVNEDMRVEWAQCVARADRWEEEVVLLREEMRRVVHFLEWKSKDWVSRADARAGVVTPAVRSGLSAYAHKQASIFRNLAVRFCQRWRSKLVSLSLSHTWAVEFLETPGATSPDPDPKKHEAGHQDHGFSGPCGTPPHAQSPTSSAAAAPLISTNPEMSDNGDSSSSSDDSSSSNDSGVDSSEFDESEYDE